MVDAEALIVVDVVGAAATEPDDEPALGDVVEDGDLLGEACLLYTSPSPRDLSTSRMPSSA